MPHVATEDFTKPSLAMPSTTQILLCRETFGRRLGPQTTRHSPSIPSVVAWYELQNQSSNLSSLTYSMSGTMLGYEI